MSVKNWLPEKYQECEDVADAKLKRKELKVKKDQNSSLSKIKRQEMWEYYQRSTNQT